jgi:MHS family proline/betaine transporter-like MFS transporter
LSALGTTLEWYDFALYLYLAPVLGRMFFSSKDGISALLATFAVLAASYLMRPIGALLFGRFGDRLGRNTALLASLTMMIVPMMVIAALPTRGTLGIAAPIALVAMRMVQGFSVGGETSGTLVLMSESSAARSRGFTSGIAMTASGLGLVLASGMAALLHGVLTSAQMHAYGWRIGFLLGATIGLVALFMRALMPETAAFAQAREAGMTSKHPTARAVTRQPRQMLMVFALAGFAGITGYLTITWLPNFLQTSLQATPRDALQRRLRQLQPRSGRVLGNHAAAGNRIDPPHRLAHGARDLSHHGRAADARHPQQAPRDTRRVADPRAVGSPSRGLAKFTPRGSRASFGIGH